jgi:hypothetical protein
VVKVTAMDERARAILDEASRMVDHGRTDEIRQRQAQPVEAPPVVVERRSYDDGRWSPPPMMEAEFEVVPEPRRPPPQPARTMTDAEIARMFAAVQADTDSKLDAVDRRFAALQAKESEMLEGIGMALAESVTGVSQQLREEFTAEIDKRSGGDHSAVPMLRGARRA